MNMKRPAWEEIKMKGKVPSYRSHFASCFDESLNRSFIHGGLSMNKE